MSRSYSPLDLTSCTRVIVGEGESDYAFWRAFCAANNITGFEFAFSGILNGGYSPSGFDVFGRFLSVLGTLAGFANLTDVVLVCDSAQGQDNRMRQLKRQIRAANRALGGHVFDETPSPNIAASQGQPRLHVLLIPENAPGGLETLSSSITTPLFELAKGAAEIALARHEAELLARDEREKAKDVAIAEAHDDEETAWLIEWPAEGALALRYYAAGRASMVTTNHLNATRFARREDAESTRIGLKLIGAKSVEHSWHKIPAPQPDPLVGLVWDALDDQAIVTMERAEQIAKFMRENQDRHGLEISKKGE